MPKRRISNLMSQLHELFGDDEVSPQQARMLQQLQEQADSAVETLPGDPAPLETVELLVEQLEAEHPRSSAVLRELVATLRNIGV